MQQKRKGKWIMTFHYTESQSAQWHQLLKIHFQKGKVLGTHTDIYIYIWNPQEHKVWSRYNRATKQEMPLWKYTIKIKGKIIMGKRTTWSNKPLNPWQKTSISQENRSNCSSPKLCLVNIQDWRRVLLRGSILIFLPQETFEAVCNSKGKNNEFTISFQNLIEILKARNCAKRRWFYLERENIQEIEKKR